MKDRSTKSRSTIEARLRLVPNPRVDIINWAGTKDA